MYVLCTHYLSVCLSVSIQLFPFIEYQLHNKLLSKMKLKGMNAVFGLRTQVAVGDTMLVAIAVS